MNKIIRLNEREIKYKLKVNLKTQCLRLTLNSKGQLVVTVPYKLSEYKIEQFLTVKANWILSKLDYLATLPRLDHSCSEKDYLQYKNKARQLVRQRVEHYVQFYGFKYNKINIKNQKSRWGSCSKQGNLNFNYRLANLPGKLTDYVVVHELCHLKEMNHSSRFWSLVAQVMPDYLERRRELKKIRID